MARKVTPLPRTRSRLMATAVSACFATSALALPTDPAVVNGAASFAQAGNVLNVTNSNGAIINWNTFSIAAGETANFIQPSSSSSVLNRVLNDPTVIFGALTSNGRVWLINPSGILVGAGARIDTAAFVASTLNITDANFLANKLRFDATPNAGSVVNQGSITTPGGGTVYLVAPNVTNEGIITTPQGETILAAGQSVTLLDTATPGVSVEITGSEGTATNLGTVLADAGRIGMAGVLVRNSGTLNASSVVNEGGRIFLKASQDAYVDGNGRIVTTGTKGGKVEVLGNRVAVMDNASIDASGTNGGGEVLVGGDFQGKNPDVRNANITYFGQNASIKADATDQGDGGKVIVWADDTTRAYGSISARGGPNGGNGGFVETSGHNYLDFDAQVDTQAANGKTGSLLLDPSDVSIVLTGTESYSVYGGVFYGGTGISTVKWSTIDSLLASTAVYITTDGSGGTGNISIAAGSFSSSNSGTLGLYAHNNISATGVTMNLTGGALNMYAGWNGSPGGYSTPGTGVNPGTGDILLTDSMFGATGVNLSAGHDITLTGATVLSSGTMDITAGNTLTVQANATNAAALASNSLQTVVAHQINVLGHTGTTTGKFALLGSNLSGQNITVGSGDTGGGGILVQGGGGTDNYAQIGSYGSQYITVYGGSASSVVLQGGSGAGGNDSATIANTGSIQSLDFYYGGSLSITGGSGGVNNWAGVHLDVPSGSATQYVKGSYAHPTITLTGGTGGGGAGGQSNDAGINIDEDNASGTQYITAASITIYGGGSATSYGGAGLGAAYQSISVDDKLAMYGGASNTVDGDGSPGSAAYIGSMYGANISLDVGSLYIKGGSGSGGKVLIGSLEQQAYVDISATDNIDINSGTAGVVIGSLSTSYGANVFIGSYSGSINVDDTGGQVLIGSAGSSSGYAYLSAAGNITLGATSGGTGVYVGNMGEGNGYVAIAAGFDEFNYYGYAYGSSGGGNITLNGSAHINSNSVSLFAASGYSTGANGDIVQKAGSTITGGYSGVGLGVGLYADGDIDLNGTITTPGRLNLYSGLTNGYYGYYYGGYLGDPYYNSQYGGDIKLGGSQITAGDLYMIANRGWDETSGDLTGNISQADNGVIHITQYDSLYGYAAGSISLPGTINVDAGAPVYLYSGYDYPGESSNAYAGKFISIGVINAPGSDVRLYATGAILDGNAGTLNITADYLDLQSAYGGTAGGLAISLDTAIATGITADVSSSATYGGISVRNVGAQPTGYVGMDDGAMYGGNLTFTNTAGLDTGLGDGMSFSTRSGNIAVTTNGNMAVSGGSFWAGTNGTIVLAAAGNMDITSTPDLGAYSGLPDLALIAGGTMNVDAMVGSSGYYGYTANNLIVGAGALNVGGAYSYGRLSAFNNVTIGTSGNIALNNGAWITNDPDDGGLVTIAAGGALSLDNSSGIGGGSGVVIGARNISLDHGSWIETGNGVPMPDIKLTISGGDLTLNNGSEIIAGNDVILKLTGSNARVVLNEVAGLDPSRIWSDANLSQGSTTHINFLGRSSGGVIIDGAQTTTTTPSGSGFFVGYNFLSASPGNGLEIVYSGQGNNIASNVIDQFFNNLAGNNPPPGKKKKDENTDSEGNNQDENDENQTGQCT